MEWSTTNTLLSVALGLVTLLILVIRSRWVWSLLGLGEVYAAAESGK